MKTKLTININIKRLSSKLNNMTAHSKNSFEDSENDFHARKERKTKLCINLNMINRKIKNRYLFIKFHQFYIGIFARERYRKEFCSNLVRN